MPHKLLTDEQVEFYKENGFIQISNIFTEQEVNEFSEEHNTLFQMKSGADLETSRREKHMDKPANENKVTVSSIYNVQYHSGVFSQLMMNNKLLDALEDIMDTPDILLHFTEAHLLLPEKNRAPYPMHQDYHYFPYKKHSMVAAFIHMEDTTPENGSFAVYPGSHKLGPLPDFGVINKGEEMHYADQEEYPLSRAKPICAKKGDVVIFSYFLLHGCYNNDSDIPRRTFLIQVRAADDEAVKETHDIVGCGFVLRGRNLNMDANMASRFEQGRP